MDNSRILEIVTGRLMADFPESAFEAAATALGPRLSAQPGFAGRRLARSEDGTWVACTEWRSMADALAAARLLNGTPAVAALNGLLDPLSLAARRYRIRIS